MPDEVVMNQIYVIRGQKVMLDKDPVILYEVETRALKQAVKRNIDRFPAEDFMFELTNEELGLLVSQSVIPDKKIFGGALPFAFAEVGVAMLSSVLKSKKAIQVNIQIIRIFTRLRQLLTDNYEVKLEIVQMRYEFELLSKKVKNHDKNIELVFEYPDRLQEKAEQPKSESKSIGFAIGKGDKKICKK